MKSAREALIPPLLHPPPIYGILAKVPSKEDTLMIIDNPSEVLGFLSTITIIAFVLSFLFGKKGHRA
jgi:hypothetical protein